MNLKILIEYDSFIVEPNMSTIGCGILKAVFPKACGQEEITTHLNKYLEENATEISSNLRLAMNDYYKYWGNMVDNILDEYGIGEYLPSFERDVKVAYTRKIVCVVPDNRGIKFKLRLTFDPISSILPEDVLDIFLRFNILHESLALYGIASNGMSVGTIKDGSISLSEPDALANPCKQKYDELCSARSLVLEKVQSEEVFSELNKLGSINCLSLTIK